MNVFAVQGQNDIVSPSSGIINREGGIAALSAIWRSVLRLTVQWSNDSMCIATTIASGDELTVV